jgi:hypothetical protein
MQMQGVEVVCVGTGDSPEANGFYESLGFSEIYTGRIWRKRMNRDYDYQPGDK